MKKRHLFQHTKIYLYLIGALFLLFPLDTWSQSVDFYADSSFYRLTPAGVNTPYAEWGALKQGTDLYFVSNRNYGQLVKHIDSRGEEKYYTLYHTTVNDEEPFIYGETEPYAKELGGKHNVGPMYMTYDGKMLIITRNMEHKSDAYKDTKKGYRLYTLQLFFYTYDEKKNKWIREEIFPYNSDKYNCAHAFLSPDGRQLYFSSNMPGSLGGMDIFVSAWDGSAWGAPQNLGPAVNTTYNEIFPTVTNGGDQLYFSSDQPGGMGGLDIYTIDLPIESQTKAHNPGAPVNSETDDFGLSFYTEKNAFFSSNRPLTLNGKRDTSDNIYYLQANLPKKTQYSISVVDSLTGLPITAALHYSFTACPNEEGTYIKQIKTDGTIDGLSLYRDKVYTFTLEKDGFDTYLSTIKPEAGQKHIKFKIPLYSRLEGTVTNTSGKPLAGTDVTVSDGDKVSHYFTDNKGYFVSEHFLGDRNLVVTATHAGLVSETMSIVVPHEPEQLKSVYSVNMVMHLPEFISLDILFKYDRSDLTQQAKDTLNQIAKVLLDQPDVVIVLQGHADSRGSAAYNRELSLRRAQSVMNYLFKKGITLQRMKVEADGYARMVNDCGKGTPCSEQQHQANRRVEFHFGKEGERVLKVEGKM